MATCVEQHPCCSLSVNMSRAIQVWNCKQPGSHDWPTEPRSEHRPQGQTRATEQIISVFFYILTPLATLVQRRSGPTTWKGLTKELRYFKTLSLNSHLELKSRPSLHRLRSLKVPREGKVALKCDGSKEARTGIIRRCVNATAVRVST